MRRLPILIALILAVGCEKKSEPTAAAPTGWSPPPPASVPTGSAVEPAK